MEEQECEVIFESKESAIKNNIIDALAAYKLKIQQQHDIIDTKASPSKNNVVTASHSTLSVKPGVSNKTPKEKKGKKISLEKLTPTTSWKTAKSQSAKNKKQEKKARRIIIKRYFSHSKNENKSLFLKNDFEVGIIEYVSPNRQGFSAAVKDYYYDFQIHEISLDGSIVHLTKMKDADVTSLLKSSPTDDKSNRKICKTQDEIQRKIQSCHYVQFVLYIENHPSTRKLIGMIIQQLEIFPVCFMTAENKNAEKSITSQMVTVKKEDCIGLLNSSQKKKGNRKWEIGNFSLASKLLQLGDLKGNHFTIALRKVIGDKCHIEANLKSLKDFGFINYYESQEFGRNREVPKHLIGKQLILKRWQEAIDLILEPRWNYKYPNKVSQLSLACMEYKSSKNVHKALDLLKTEMNAVPAKLLSSMKIHGDDLCAALEIVPFKLRLSFIRAYQCFIWNKIVSKRFAKFGVKLIVGDLVIAPRNNDQNNNDILVKMEGNSERCKYNEQHNQREVIFVDENNIHKYTIYDVVLPLPRHDIIYPANEVADWYKDLFLADGVLEKDFNRNSKTYRHVMLRPSDLKWKFVHYDNSNQRLISSDMDRLEQISLPPVALQSGAYLGLVLEFSLPAFAFASMALREILRMDMTTNLQNAAESAKAISQDSQIKKTNEKPFTTTELSLSETKNDSFLDTNKNCSASASIVLSPKSTPLTKIKLECGTIEKQSSLDCLVEHSTIYDCPPLTSESQLKGIRLEPSTIESLPLATKELFEEHQLKKEPEANEIPAQTAKDSSGELRRLQLTVNDCSKEPQTKCKEEPEVRQTRSSSFTESCEEPAKKKIKINPDTNQEEVTVIPYSSVSKFKSIIYIDLTSNLDD